MKVVDKYTGEEFKTSKELSKILITDSRGFTYQLSEVKDGLIVIRTVPDNVPLRVHIDMDMHSVNTITLE